MILYFLVDQSENVSYGNFPISEEGKTEYSFEVDSEILAKVQDGELDFKIINDELQTVSSTRKQDREDLIAQNEVLRVQAEQDKQDLKEKLQSGTATLEDLSQALLKIL